MSGLAIQQPPINEDSDDDYDEALWCKVCGDSGHRCLEELPQSLMYDAYAAMAVDEPVDIHNYCGGEPMGFAEDTWPTCPKHGPLLFLWQMTDQKHPDPCLIQAFICGEWIVGHGAWDPKLHLSVNLSCHRGEYLHKNESPIHYDVVSNKNFGYLMRRVFPRPGLQFLHRPTDRHITRISANSSIYHTKREPTAADDQDKDIIDRERIIEKKFLRWDKVRMPYTVEEAQQRAEVYSNDPGRYFYFGKDPTNENLDLIMDHDSMRQAIADVNDELEKYTLFHHTLGYCAQHPPPHNQGYIFMRQEAGYLGLSIHGNPAGGIGITRDLTMHFVL